MNLVVNAKRVSFLVDIEEIRGGAVTMGLRNKIVDYGALYEASFAALMDAVKRQDAESMKLHFDAVVYYEEMQRQAAMKTRMHLLARAKRVESGTGLDTPAATRPTEGGYE